MKNLPRLQRRTREAGVTLIELMIAMLLSLVLLGGMIQIFVGNRATYAFNEGLSRLQENARFALDYVSNETRMAGYVGCLRSLGINNALVAGNDFRYDLEGGLQGFEADGTAPGDVFEATAIDPAPLTDETKWNPALPADIADRVLPGSDVLVVRRVGAQSNNLVFPFSSSTALYTTQPDLFLQGQVLVVTDCLKATIFQVTNNPLAVGEVTLLHAAGGGMSPGNAVATATWPTEQTYGLGSEVGNLQTVVFFIGRGATGTPALFQQRLRRQSATTTAFDPPEELVDGIDTMQLRYGFDGDHNGTIDDWLTAPEVEAAGDWTDVGSVEVSLLARAAEESGTVVDTASYALGGMTFDVGGDSLNDRRFRRAFSTVIALRNRVP